ncbi:Sir2 family NAD-dependent protein deacetylase [Granulosicoccaceae sp. 1_MG-2023]|nr:Sir2 family NAD-dependent protein deacetylase [Granulosicoccaceae sp. 1_MG-2023]
MARKPRVAVITGAGISAESGLKTFRDGDGLWCNHAITDVATPEAFERNPALVHNFYNERRRQARAAQPNAAHLALAQLQHSYDVTVITQNIDDLHERSGSSQVIHLHGELDKARSEGDPSHVVQLNGRDLSVEDRCPRGHRLRPDIVWFGEPVPLYEPAMEIVAEADKVLVVGTSLSVYPAAGLLADARPDAEKLIVTLELDNPPYDYHWLQQPAARGVPAVVQQWLG